MFLFTVLGWLAFVVSAVIVSAHVSDVALLVRQKKPTAGVVQCLLLQCVHIVTGAFLTYLWLRTKTGGLIDRILTES